MFNFHHFWEKKNKGNKERGEELIFPFNPVVPGRGFSFGIGKKQLQFWEDPKPVCSHFKGDHHQAWGYFGLFFLFIYSLVGLQDFSWLHRQVMKG